MPQEGGGKTRKIWGPEGGEAQLSRFFPCPVAKFRSFSLSLGVFFVELCPQFKVMAHPKCAFRLMRGEKKEKWRGGFGTEG